MKHFSLIHKTKQIANSDKWIVFVYGTSLYVTHLLVKKDVSLLSTLTSTKLMLVTLISIGCLHHSLIWR